MPDDRGMLDGPELLVKLELGLGAGVGRRK